MRVFSEDHRRKLSERAKARMANPEYKARVMQSHAESLKNPEVIERISQAQLKRFNDPANAQRNAIEKENRKQGMQKPESRAKISETRKRESPEVRKARGLIIKEAMNTPEYKQKCSEARKASHSRPEVKENLSKAQKKRFERSEERQKTSERTKDAMKEVVARPGYIEKMRQAGLRWWDNPENRAKQLAILEASKTPENLQKWARAMKLRGRTSIEIMIAQVLDTLQIEYEDQKRIGRYIADFYIPDRNLVVECDGDYWHGRKPGAKEKGERKDTYLLAQGYRLVRLPECKIRAGELEQLYSALFPKN